MTNIYYIILDTETTNDIDCPIVYDFGFAVIDEQANVYDKFSFVVSEVFLNKQLMESAYFKEKIPQYWKEIKNGSRTLARLSTIRNILYYTMKYYKTNMVIAHNVRFDYRSSQTTQRYLTQSRYRWFFPYGTQFIDTLKMARLTFKNDKEYNDFCIKNEYLCKNGSLRFTAEILYRYLTQDIGFEEEHTGLADVMIEKEIFKSCIDKGCEVEEGLIW